MTNAGSDLANWHGTREDGLIGGIAGRGPLSYRTGKPCGAHILSSFGDSSPEEQPLSNGAIADNVPWKRRMCD